MNQNSFILGVSLDGVIGDFYDTLRKGAAQWLNKPLETLTTDVNFYLDEWGIAEYGGYESFLRFMITQRNLYREMEPIKGAPAALRKFSGQGIRIRIISHRFFLKYSHKTIAAQTVDWLDHWDIPYWDLCFLTDTGAVGAHIYIDNSPVNVR